MTTFKICSLPNRFVEHRGHYCCFIKVLQNASSVCTDCFRPAASALLVFNRDAEFYFFVQCNQRDQPTALSNLLVTLHTVHCNFQLFELCPMFAGSLWLSLKAKCNKILHLCGDFCDAFAWVFQTSESGLFSQDFVAVGALSR